METNKTNFFSVVNLADYERPKVKEEYGLDWIKYGEDNAYYDSIIERYLSSPTNARCINGIADMIYGKGLEAVDRNINRDSYIEMKKLIDGAELRKVVGDRKLLGAGCFKIKYNDNKTKVISITHHPQETLRAAKAVNGVIKHYFYHPDWKNRDAGDKLKKVPVFGHGTDKQLTELYVVKPYVSGFYYYAPCDYQSALQYASLEGEVSNYHLSNIENGLQPSLLINFNNGVPDENTQTLMEQKINRKFSGSSNGGKFILAFNEDKDTAAEVLPIHLPDAHAQYEFLANECRDKIMLGHGITSPILFGIKDNTGFGNNAEELRTASILMDNIVIRPFQENIISALNEILAYNKIFLSLYFVTLQPIEFVELDNISTSVVKEKETGEKVSLSEDEIPLLSEEDEDVIVEQLLRDGEKVSDDWEELYTADALDGSNGVKLASNDSSREDNGVYKIRYRYEPVRKSSGSRNFCRRIESLTEKGMVYRKEDINQMSLSGVNREFGHKKRNYSLLKYKGGVNCHHYWTMVVYKKKGTGSVNLEKAIEEGLRVPNNPDEMGVRPIDMPNQGRVKTKLKEIIKKYL
tara:strand:+ start:108 stop:1841 length:1734 start_codon:yes stop_codon:yes gene_type:complete